MADEMPAIGNRVVHKDDYTGRTGPVWHVTQQLPKEEKVTIAHVPGHVLNELQQPEARIIPVPEFHKDYVQL